MNDNTNTMDGDAELRLAIMSSIAQEESRKISERVKWVQKRQMKQGVVFGRDIVQLVYSFSTFERVGKYDERKNAQNVEKPYSIEIGDTKRTINQYVIASLRFVVAFE